MSALVQMVTFLYRYPPPIQKCSSNRQCWYCPRDVHQGIGAGLETILSLLILMDSLQVMVTIKLCFRVGICSPKVYKEQVRAPIKLITFIRRGQHVHNFLSYIIYSICPEISLNNYSISPGGSCFCRS